MAATMKMISEWFDRGVKQKKTHMVVLCDDFDHEDYPSYFSSRKEAEYCVDHPGKMQRPMEVYHLLSDKQPQLNQRRCWNYGP